MDQKQLRMRGVLFGLVAIHLGLMGFLTSWYSPTEDEVAHLPAGLAIWKFGRTDLYRVNPPLVRALAALPVTLIPHKEDWSHYVPGSPRRSEWDVGSDFVVANGKRSLWLYSIARWPCLVFSVIGLVVCWYWGRGLVGPGGGVIAATLWCFSPNLIGHGALITCDVAATATGLLAAWRFQHWLRDATWRNAFLAGVCLGLALLTKTYWMMLLGLWPLIAGITFLIQASGTRQPFDCTEHREIDISRSPASTLGQMAVILLLGLNLLNLGYGFQGTGTPLRQYGFYSGVLAGTHRDLELDRPGNRFRDWWMGSLPVLLPRDYITGIDLQKHDFEKTHVSYLLGQSRKTGWWFYYVIGLGVKVPLGTWGLVLLGAWTGARASAARTRFLNLLPQTIPVTLLFLIVSAETGMNRHVRYVFPVLPLLYLIAAQCALLKIRWVPAIPLAASVVAGLAVFPDSLSFFNLAAGGPKNGGDVLIHSNLDWGQDLARAGKWLSDHPQCRPATIAPVAGFPYQAIGIDVPLTPPGKPAPGWHLISIHLLRSSKNSYSSFRKLRPVGRVGLTFNIYHVSD